MKVRTFSVADATFERSSGQDGAVFAGNVVDQRRGAARRSRSALAATDAAWLTG